MTTFEPEAVRDYVSSVTTRIDRCDNGEGTECATLDGQLRHYAEVCREFHASLCQWGRAVFGGRVAFDAGVEAVWRAKLADLYARSAELLAYGDRLDGRCYQLDGKDKLEAVMHRLRLLIDHWVSPQLSVGPAARMGGVLNAEARARIAALPPLPADWQPATERQAQMLKRIRNSKKS